MSPARRRLLLFVAGDEPNSQRARANLSRVHQAEFVHDYDVEVIDVLEDYRPALQYSVLVTPALVVERDGERVTILGDLRDEDRLREILSRTESRAYGPEPDRRR